MPPSEYDFDTLIDRRASASMKWQRYAGRDIIPLWVADMDFASPPAVVDALRQRVEHRVFGYTLPPPELEEAVCDTLLQRYRWQVEPPSLVWLPGLVTGLNVCCRAAGGDGDEVLTSVPVYPPFLSAPKHSGRRLRTIALKGADDNWEPDLQGIERAAGPAARLFILCNPHNPTGRVYRRTELERLAEICAEHDLVICADEIHCDLVLDSDRQHLPIATLGPEIERRTITLMAPSKTYNLPGLGCAFAVIPDPDLRRRFRAAMAGIVPSVNLFGYVAALAAYRQGGDWLEGLLETLRGNRDRVVSAVNRMDGLSLSAPEATYLAWIDTRGAGLEDPVAFFEAAGVGLSDGRDFGAPGFVRLNFGCPGSLLRRALDRMRWAMKHRPAAETAATTGAHRHDDDRGALE